MKHYLHVNQHVIKSNSKKGEFKPVITCKNYKKNTYANKITLKDKSVLARKYGVSFATIDAILRGSRYKECNYNNVEVEYE
jgi:hypothetical protein